MTYLVTALPSDGLMVWLPNHLMALSSNCFVIWLPYHVTALSFDCLIPSDYLFIWLSYDLTVLSSDRLITWLPHNLCLSALSSGCLIIWLLYPHSFKINHSIVASEKSKPILETCRACRFISSSIQNLIKITIFKMMAFHGTFFLWLWKLVHCLILGFSFQWFVIAKHFISNELRTQISTSVTCIII